MEASDSFREPTADELNALAAEHIGATVRDDPEAVASLAAIGITLAAWRNTHLENLHAGSHPSGGFNDARMMRFNIATSRLVLEHVTAEGVDWSGLHDALEDPDRELPGAVTVGEIAGDEFDDLADDVHRALLTGEAVEDAHGPLYAMTWYALRAGLSYKSWYGSPWWSQTVDAFVEMLDDRDSPAWRHDDGTEPEPESVADRATLRGTLLSHPEELDDEGLYWCLAHGLDYRAASVGYAHWREQREPGWTETSHR